MGRSGGLRAEGCRPLGSWPVVLGVRTQHTRARYPWTPGASESDLYTRPQEEAGAWVWRGARPWSSQFSGRGAFLTCSSAQSRAGPPRSAGPPAVPGRPSWPPTRHCRHCHLQEARHQACWYEGVRAHQHVLGKAAGSHQLRLLGGRSWARAGRTLPLTVPPSSLCH